MPRPAILATCLGWLIFLSLTGSVCSANLAKSKTALTSSKNPADVGTPITLTAKVTPALGSSTLSGSVLFLDGDSPLTCGTSGKVTLTNSVAHCQVSYSAAGSHTLAAQFAGSATVQGSSASLVQIIGSGTLPPDGGATATQTTLTSSKNPADVGMPITLTARVTPTLGSSTLSGSVLFLDGDNPLTCGTSGKVTLMNSVAPCQVSYSAAGSHTLAAQFAGSATVQASSASLVQIIGSGTLPPNGGTTATQTTLTSSKNPATVGDTLTLTASISPTSGQFSPGGSVTFKDNGTLIDHCGSQGVVPLTSGSASCAVTYSEAKSHTILASYSGDSQFSASTATLNQILNHPKQPVTVIFNAPATAEPDSHVTLTVVVSSQSSGTTPVGTVTFLNGSGALADCSKLPLVSGNATCTFTPALGSHVLSVSYPGDSQFEAGQSVSRTLTVAKSLPPLPQAIRNPVQTQVAIGGTSRATLGLRNLSTQDIPIQNISLFGGDFMPSRNGCDNLLEMGGDCTLDTLFTPRRLGPQQTLLTVVTPGGNLEMTVNGRSWSPDGTIDVVTLTQGDRHQLTLSLQMDLPSLENPTATQTTPPQTSMGNLYLARFANGELAFHDGQDWQPWQGGAIPVYAQEFFPGSTRIPVFRNEDLSEFATQDVLIFAGYGKKQEDLLGKGQFRLAYTLGKANSAEDPGPTDFSALVPGAFPQGSGELAVESHIQGSLEALSLTVNLEVLPEHQGLSGRVWLLANTRQPDRSQRWWIYDGDRWLAWTQNFTPSMRSEVLGDVVEVTVANRQSTKGLDGTEIWVGYGSADFADMLRAGRIQRAYVVP